MYRATLSGAMALVLVLGACSSGHESTPDGGDGVDACVGSDACAPEVDAGYDITSHTFLITPRSKHGAIACVTCHTRPDDLHHAECISCHDHDQRQTDAVHAGVSEYAYSDSACLACHPTGTVQFLRSTHDPFFPIDTGSAHATVECVACHTDPANRRIISCIDCHAHDEPTMRAAHSTVADYTFETAACLRCHAP